MNLNRRVRLAGMIAGFIAPVTLLAALTGAQEGKKPVLAGQSKKFKNIKVLKEVPEDQVIPIMHNWSTALGVGCDYCHTINTDSSGKHTGFELDGKRPKSHAREMELMCKELPKRYKTLEDKTSCFMCHKGAHYPVMEAAPASK